MAQNFPWLFAPETRRLAAAFPVGTLRFVGGAVRDSLLGKPVSDIDAATILLPEAVMELLTKAAIKAIPTGILHGTITAVIDGKSFQITTLRKDVATDGRHAEVAFSDDWKTDAARRDFTMNALYLSPDGELFDYFGGERDAKAGRVTFIGDANARIREDYLRILRFFRFHAWYGKGEPDAQAIAACANNAAGINALSGERVRQEMLKLLAAPIASYTLSIIPPDALRRIFGFTLHHLGPLTQLESVEKQAGLAPDALLRLFLLLPSEAAFSHVARKWRLSNEEKDRLYAWQTHRVDIKADMDEATAKKVIRALGKSVIIPLIHARWAQAPEQAGEWQALATLAKNWIVPVFPVRGEDLIARGMAPGRALGDALKTMETRWEGSGYTLKKEDLL